MLQNRYIFALLNLSQPIFGHDYPLFTMSAKLSRPLLSSACALILSASASAPAHAGWASDPLDNAREIFLFADTNGNNRISKDERARLRSAFLIRHDLKILDTDRNGKLSREEIDALDRHRSRKGDKPNESRRR
jgi:hypothetical protein